MALSAFSKTNSLILYYDAAVGLPWEEARAGDVIEFVALGEGRMNAFRDRLFHYVLSNMDSHTVDSVIDLKDYISQFTALEINLISRENDFLGIPYETMPAFLCFILAPFIWKYSDLFKTLVGILATIYMLFSLLFENFSTDMPWRQYQHHFALYWAHYGSVLPLFILEYEWFYRCLAQMFVGLFFLRSCFQLYYGVLEKRWRSLIPFIPLLVSINYNAGAELRTCTIEVLIMHIRLAVYLVLLKLISRVDYDFASYHAKAIRSPKKFLEMVSLCLAIELAIIMLADVDFTYTVLSNIFRFVLFWSVFYNAALPDFRKLCVSWVSRR